MMGPLCISSIFMAVHSGGMPLQRLPRPEPTLWPVLRALLKSGCMTEGLQAERMPCHMSKGKKEFVACSNRMCSMHQGM